MPNKFGVYLFNFFMLKIGTGISFLTIYFIMSLIFMNYMQFLYIQCILQIPPKCQLAMVLRKIKQKYDSVSYRYFTSIEGIMLPKLIMKFVNCEKGLMWSQ